MLAVGKVVQHMDRPAECAAREITLLKTAVALQHWITHSHLVRNKSMSSMLHKTAETQVASSKSPRRGTSRQQKRSCKRIERQQCVCLQLAQVGDINIKQPCTQVLVNGTLIKFMIVVLPSLFWTKMHFYKWKPVQYRCEHTLNYMLMDLNHWGSLSEHFAPQLKASRRSPKHWSSLFVVTAVCY